MKDLNIYKDIDPVDLHHWIEERKSFILINTLKSDNFAQRHIINSFNACVFEVTFIDQVKAITADKDSTIVLYGTSKRSSDAVTAAGKLVQNGYKTIYVLNGGIHSWLSEGFTLEGDAVNEPYDPQTVLTLQDGLYHIDTDKSIIEWIGRNPTTTHFGTVEIERGEIRIADGIITGEFDIDMNSIKNINLEGDELQPVLIDHLKSDDFFLTKVFPTASYKIDKAVPVKEPFLSSPNYEVFGNLELRGVKAPQNFTATFSNTPENKLMAEAHFDIDRTKWGIIYGSTRFFESLGMHMVFDLISLQIRVVTN